MENDKHAVLIVNFFHPHWCEQLYKYENNQDLNSKLYECEISKSDL